MKPADPAILPHLEHIRDTLWKTPGAGTASVMVGAGFSRNALPAVMGARCFPLWTQLAECMAKGIGLPPEKTTDPLRLAQMYASLRTPTDLHRLIEAEIPDAEHQPGPTHHRLLSLPWADVFTTNYDTLLERAASEVFERRYEIVRAPMDIPMRRRPRLVKLHGTVGIGHPLIATEEDYRRYPSTYAPFVTLVRGAVMETVFVLIGFAGDDPNFLAWVGWVRDVLGAHAPNIYLCGLLDSTPAVNALLRERKVTPVDLSAMFPASLGEVRHAQAIEWMLGFFHSGKPLSPFNWAPDGRSPSVAPSPASSAWTPSPVPPQRTPAGQVEITAEALRETIRAWRAQRNEYPGWHVAPNAIRQRIESRLEEWNVIVFRNNEALSVSERLLLARELCWRLDLCLNPLSTSEADQLVQWLEAINPYPDSLTLPSAEIPKGGPSSLVAEAWRALALHILRTAREDLDKGRFTLWKARLESVAAYAPDIIGELWHEQLLWDLNALDLPAFRVTLTSWKSSARRPLELMRLASCFAEKGDSINAIELAMAALQGIRGFQRTPEAVSLEAWCCFLLSALHTFDWTKRKEWGDRIQATKADGYDLWDIFNDLRDKLREVRPSIKPAKQKVAGFDPGAVRLHHNFSGNGSSVLPAFRLLRLMETAPCPVHTGNVNMLGDSATHAAVWLDQNAPHWSLSTILRAQAKPEVLNEIFDRAAIVLLPVEQANTLIGTLRRVVTQEIDQLLHAEKTNADDLGLRIAKTSMELLSRFTLRMSPSELMELLRLSVTWLSQSTLVSRRSHNLKEELHTLSKRIIQSLPDEFVSPAVSVCLEVALPGEGGISVEQWEAKEDLIESFWGRSPPPELRDSTSWQNSWPRIITGLQKKEPVVRQHAFHRALYVYEQKWLTPSETKEFAEALWSQTDANSGLPTLHNIRLAILRFLPSPDGKDAEGLVKQELLGRTLATWTKEPNTINLGKVTETRVWLEELRATFRHPATSPAHDKPLTLSENEIVQLTERLRPLWAQIEKLRSKKASWALFGDDSSYAGMWRAVSSLIGDSLLLHLPQGHAAARELEGHLNSHASKVHELSAATVGQLHQNPSLEPHIFAELEKALLSENDETLKAATKVLIRWSQTAKARLTSPVPLPLIRLVVQRFALRKAPALDTIMHCLDNLLKTCPESFEEELIALCGLGLDSLAEETEAANLRRRYQAGDIDRVFVTEALHYRAWAGGIASDLAAMLTQKNTPLPDSLKKWRAICANEILPEVRRAWSHKEST